MKEENKKKKSEILLSQYDEQVAATELGEQKMLATRMEMLASGQYAQADFNAELEKTKRLQADLEIQQSAELKYMAAREDLARVEEARAEMEFTKADPEATESERLIAQEAYQTSRREAVQTHGREFLVNAHQGRVVWGPGKYSDTLGPQIEEMSSYPAVIS